MWKQKTYVETEKSTKLTVKVLAGWHLCLSAFYQDVDMDAIKASMRNRT